VNTSTASFVAILGQMTEMSLRKQQLCSLQLLLSEMNSFLFGHWEMKMLIFSGKLK